MTSLIVVSAEFEATWPFVADHWHNRWRAESVTRLVRVARGDARPLGKVAGNLDDMDHVSRMAVLGTPVTVHCVEMLPSLREAAILGTYRPSVTPEVAEVLAAQGVELYEQRSEGFWGESVAEFGLGLTICALRGIPQQYHSMLTGHEVWERYSAKRNRGPGQVGAQFSDDVRFTNGTVAGKRVRVVGAGNIGSRYASFAHMLGADVAIWDPLAAEPGFHRAGARRVWRLEELVPDAEIFAPMLPLTEQTRGIVTAEHIHALPTGCLVVLVTRAGICDMAALRRRVLADELALAADVFDVEPLPLDDPLLGRANVVHTPHIAGRTRDANVQWVEMLLAQFRHDEFDGSG
jgi:phosphoglycerate dehydrogenase-like enzyme